MWFGQKGFLLPAFNAKESKLSPPKCHPRSNTTLCVGTLARQNCSPCNSKHFCRARFPVQKVAGLGRAVSRCQRPSAKELKPTPPESPSRRNTTLCVENLARQDCSSYICDECCRVRSSVQKVSRLRRGVSRHGRPAPRNSKTIFRSVLRVGKQHSA